jgi:hypothetical protein
MCGGARCRSLRVPHAQKPVAASVEVIADEAARIRGVCGHTCPITAVLDRVVVTPTGVTV